VVVAKRLPEGRVLVGTAEVPLPRGLGTWPFVRGLRIHAEGTFPRVSPWLEEDPLHAAAPADAQPSHGAPTSPHRDGDPLPTVQTLAPVERAILAGLPRFLVLNALLALAPQLIAAGVVRVLGLAVPLHAPAFHALTALIAIAVMAVYARLMGALPDIRAVFQLNAVLQRLMAVDTLGLPVSTATLRLERSFHPFASATAILLSVLFTMGVAIGAGSAAPAAFGDSVVGHASLVGLKVAVVPLVIAVTYEVQAGLSRLYEVDALRAPLRALLAFQLLWVREPTEDQLALAVIAYRALR
jgi:uncharacterized protein YqhQ